MGQPLNRIKGNRSVGESGKVNPTILYRNELGPEKRTITQEYMANDSQGTKNGNFNLQGLKALKSKVHFYIYALFIDS